MHGCLLNRFSHVQLCTTLWTVAGQDPHSPWDTHSSILAWGISWTEALVSCSSWGHKELDMTKWLSTHTHTHTQNSEKYFVMNFPLVCFVILQLYSIHEKNRFCLSVIFIGGHLYTVLIVLFISHNIVWEMAHMLYRAVIFSFSLLSRILLYEYATIYLISSQCGCFRCCCGQLCTQ